MTKAELMKALKALGKISDEQRNSVVCSLIGHSNIIEGCWGYMHCARCDAQIGDTLAGAYQNDKAVIVGHDCKFCRANFKKLTWQDKLFCPPNPLKRRAP